MKNRTYINRLSRIGVRLRKRDLRRELLMRRMIAASRISVVELV